MSGSSLYSRCIGCRELATEQVTRFHVQQPLLGF